MFGKVSFLIPVLLLYVSSFSQTTPIPDANFEQALIDLVIDSDGVINGAVLTSDINTITSLDIQNRNIQNLSGIEDFSALTELFCGTNAIANIDVTQLLNLERLWCESNQLTTLDITQNPNLVSLVCGNNQLNNLDVSNNLTLLVLACENNQISTLDISNNTALNRFQCNGNLLSVLDVMSNTNLSFFSCNNNLLSSLNLNNNVQLATFNCAFNQITQLDLSNNSRLTSLICNNNLLCSLNVRNGNNDNLTTMNFSSNTNLNCVIVDSPNSINPNWQPISFLNYVSAPEGCSNQIPVDELEDFIGTSYTLPFLLNGAYFSEPNGNGMPFFPGDIINTSQVIYIYASTSCFANESNFNVIISNANFLIPKFFTPNNDGTNDTWKVVDNSGSFTSIYIYNRFGKLLKSLTPNNFEWDGTFNGKLMNSDDYWFVINRDLEIPIKGHFTLKR